MSLSKNINIFIRYLFCKEKIILNLLDVDANAILLINAEKHLTYNIVHLNVRLVHFYALLIFCLV